MTYRLVVIVIPSDALTVMGYVSISYLLQLKLKTYILYFIIRCNAKFSVTTETIFKNYVSNLRDRRFSKLLTSLLSFRATLYSPSLALWK